ncbi:MAG TPA: heavy metal-associated domain-containing protein [Afifellaceae bacterium]|nr:heavy metal-associated domain-containing protein [Afifellaceae bacterium]
MANELQITGMHCGGCVNRVAKALRALDAGVTVTLEPPRAVFSPGVQIPLATVNETLAKIGDYRATASA